MSEEGPLPFGKYEPTDAKKAWIKAMSELQRRMEPLKATRVNPQARSRYADLKDVLEFARPIWTELGFAFTFGESTRPPEAGMQTLEMYADHIEGYTRVYPLRVPYDGAGIQGGANKTPVQAMGSSLTYGKRYLLTGILGVSIDHDDDGATDTVGGKSDDAPASPGLIDAVKKLAEQKGVDVEAKFGVDLDSVNAKEAQDLMLKIRKA